MRKTPLIRLIPSLAAAVAVLGVCIPGHADTWKVTRITDGAVPAAIVPEGRRAAPDGLPDGLIATPDQPGNIAATWYAEPTARYGHGILGDAIEAGTLMTTTVAGRRYSLKLPSTEVFEDRYPRLADLDGDGTMEIVTIRSSLTRGAAVTVYGVRDGTLRQLATTEFIGRANRWLNIAGIAAFRGKRSKEIAYVQTPHIGGTLFVYAFENGQLVRVASLFGFSNHVIGSAEMRLSAIADIDGDGRPELALPSATRDRLRIVGIGTRVIERASIRVPASIDKAIGLQGEGPSLKFIVGIDDGRIFKIGR